MNSPSNGIKTYLLCRFHYHLGPRPGERSGHEIGSTVLLPKPTEIILGALLCLVPSLGQAVTPACKAVMSDHISPIETADVFRRVSVLPVQKDEFETSAAYRQRLNALVARTREDSGAFMLTVQPRRPDWSYDADRARLKLNASVVGSCRLWIDAAAQQRLPTSLDSTQAYVCLLAETDSNDTGVSTRANVFGVERQVVTRNVIERILSFRTLQQSSAPDVGPDVFSLAGLEIAIAPERARELRDNLIMQVVFTLKFPIFAADVSRSVPRIENPVETHRRVEALFAEIGCVIVRDRVTNAVVREFVFADNRVVDPHGIYQNGDLTLVANQSGIFMQGRRVAGMDEHVASITPVFVEGDLQILALQVSSRWGDSYSFFRLEGQTLHPVSISSDFLAKDPGEWSRQNGQIVAKFRPRDNRAHAGRLEQNTLIIETRSLNQPVPADLCRSAYSFYADGCKGGRTVGTCEQQFADMHLAFGRVGLGTMIPLQAYPGFNLGRYRTLCINLCKGGQVTGYEPFRRSFCGPGVRRQ